MRRSLVRWRYLNVFGDHALEAQGEHVGGFAGVVVQALRTRWRKSKAFAKFLAGVRARGSRGRLTRSSSSRVLEEGIGNPEEVMEVAHASRGSP